MIRHTWLAQMGPHRGAHGPMGGGMAGGLLSTVLWLVVLAAVVVAMGYLVVRVRRAMDDDGATGGDTAMAVLRERYAAGDIDDEEFTARRRTLERERDETPPKHQ
ncbi:SHOCT domain-containing protein [Halobacterium salinarum]|uniref:SHOCT domain-containing protein n=2 Tax=Halobacterium TaxID=2239 RepID=UPI00159ED35D|nr:MULTISPECIES: SHOCT domain-containing protein [Halobacterium]QRY21676.1 SHOCT domain-containing protein [Halobacterium sp. GSL-19]MCF2164932.1 SHOCT domain-containing protein [Halobacterium salinarum]MCF2168974.1 SHOCT domain-containing protein [Halobacterium salinarum]MCF2237698.1 SHOCT domain-containing protein [Halobacterium salinarum]MDL0132836.1 SHOCT domain-containing protein [Halobacterium salinarum]